MAAPRPFKYPKGGQRKGLIIPKERELPVDPLERFQFWKEVIRRAANVAWHQLYRMKDELEAVASACHRSRDRRFLLDGVLRLYQSESLPGMFRRLELAAKAQEIISALDTVTPAPTTSPAAPRPGGLRLLKGGRA